MIEHAVPRHKALFARALVAAQAVIALLALLCVLLAGDARAASPTGPLDPVKARLVAEHAAVAPGQTLWVDLHLDIDKGWHVYWRNPGDSGLPTEIAWTLPAGFAAGDIAWPVPERFVTGDIGNYGYGGSADLLVPITAPADAAGGAQHVEAHANWLVCSDICIPGEKTLALDLPVGATAPPADQATAPLFATARERLPKAEAVDASFDITGRDLRISVAKAALTGLTNPTVSFFPNQANVIDAASAPRQEKRGDGLDLVLTRVSGPTAKTPEKLDGVLVLRAADGAERAYTIALPRAAAPPPQNDEAATGWAEALLLAFLGGLVLNLMPCVFPVLSLKLIGLAEAVHRAEQRRHALAYAAGVIVSFTVLGGILLGLRSGGAAVGWGFQLQSPVVVALLAYLLFAMGLSLSGAAEFGAGLVGAGGRWTEKSGIAGAFGTGILATIVATPCTAPFMGTALGFALIAPVPVALAVFVALGCGLAAPVALASVIPGIARLMPRPGPWMLWFKQLLAFPLYATVAWLIWVLLQEIGPANAFPALLGLVAVGFSVWIYGRTRFSAGTGRHLGTGLAASALATAFVIGGTLSSASAPVAAERTDLGYEPFSATRLASLSADHKGVFVNLTAAWCITCLVNERTTLDRNDIRRAFADHGIVVLKGDWTRQDPDITALLQKFGRSGVPLYLLYGPDGTPTVLPQILTEATVLDALAKI